MEWNARFAPILPPPIMSRAGSSPSEGERTGRGPLDSSTEAGMTARDKPLPYVAVGLGDYVAVGLCDTAG